MEVKKKANKILGVLQRNLASSSAVFKERGYLTLVRPVYEYDSVAWSPYTQKDINCVESVHRRAARFVCNDYRHTSSINIMLSNLRWQDLETRRRITDLTMLFKIKTGNVRISFPDDLREVDCPYSTRASAQHPFQFHRFLSNVNAHKFSFFVRSVPVWNALSPASVCEDCMLLRFTHVFVIKLQCVRFCVREFNMHFIITFFYLRCQCYELPCTDRPLPD